MAPYATSNNATVKFRYTSASGGSLNIDNVAFDNMTPTSINEQQRPVFKMYPNPTKGLVYFAPGDDLITKVELMDISGKVIKEFVNSKALKKDISLNVSEFKNGIYLISVYTGETVKTEKLIISK